MYDDWITLSTRNLSLSQAGRRVAVAVRTLARSTVVASANFKTGSTMDDPPESRQKHV